MNEYKDRGLIATLDTGLIALLVIVLLAVLNVSGITLEQLYRELASMVLHAYLFVF